MHEQYNPQLIEQQLQQEWEQTNAFKVVEDASKEKYYCLIFICLGGYIYTQKK